MRWPLTATGSHCLARRVERIQALAGELGDGAIAIEADVTDRDSIVAAAERVHSELGGADILVNNAGVMLLAPFTSDQRAEHRQMVEVNLLGAMTATEVFLDQLRDGGGDLVNISSVAGRTARAGNAVVCGDQVGDQRLVGGAAPGAATRHPRDGHRARRRGHRADRPHHRRRDQAGHPAVRQGDRHHGRWTSPRSSRSPSARPRRMTLNEILIRPTAQPN